MVGLTSATQRFKLELMVRACTNNGILWPRAWQFSSKSHDSLFPRHLEIACSWVMMQATQEDTSGFHFVGHHDRPYLDVAAHWSC